MAKEPTQVDDAMVIDAARTDKSLTFTDEFKYRVDITKAFCDTAKTYVQLSLAALALPLLFTQMVLGKNVADQGLQGVPWALTVSWFSFLLTVAFGQLYQWLAIRRVWNELHSVVWSPPRSGEPGIRHTKTIPTFERFNRSYLYGAMLVFFFLGALFFLIFAGQRLGWSTPSPQSRPDTLAPFL